MRPTVRRFLEICATESQQFEPQSVEHESMSEHIKFLFSDAERDVLSEVKRLLQAENTPSPHDKPARQRWRTDIRSNIEQYLMIVLLVCMPLESFQVESMNYKIAYRRFVDYLTAYHAVNDELERDWRKKQQFQKALEAAMASGCEGPEILSMIENSNIT